VPGDLGYYGKIAALGDFVRKGARPAFVDVWDPWLQAGFQASRNALGDGWMAAYESAPIWRFVFAGGVCGPVPRLGVMMPSMDAVGRCFPLTIFVRLQQAAAEQVLELPFLRALEDVALGTLDPEHSREALDCALAALEVPEFTVDEENTAKSHWLSTFSAGREQTTWLHFAGLPDPAEFTRFLRPDQWGGPQAESEGTDV
jgi:type VI secretion system protein ImpM